MASKKSKTPSNKKSSQPIGTGSSSARNVRDVPSSAPQPNFYPNFQQDQPQMFSFPQFPQQFAYPTPPQQFGHNVIAHGRSYSINDIERYAMREPTRPPRVEEDRPLPIFEDLDDDDFVPETQNENVNEMEFDVEDDEAEEVGGSKQNTSNRAKPEPWTTDQEVALAKAWCYCSENKLIGNQQTGRSFWNKILKKYTSFVGPNKRTNHQLNSKWKVMHTKITEFNGLYIQAERLRASGSSDDAVMKKATEDYKQRHPMGFTHIGAWEIVRTHDKWMQVPLMGEDDDSHSDKRRKSSEAGNYSEGGNPHVPDLNEDNAPPRKHKGKQKKVAESSSSLVDEFGSYRSMKQEQLNKWMDIKVKQSEEAIALMAEQREALAQKVLDRDLKTFVAPHDGLSGAMLEVVLKRKCDIAAKYNWPCDF